jgi:hypothetical protein
MMMVQGALIFLVGAVLFLGLTVLAVAALGTAFIWYLAWRARQKAQASGMAWLFPTVTQYRINGQGKGRIDLVDVQEEDREE